MINKFLSTLFFVVMGWSALSAQSDIVLLENKLDTASGDVRLVVLRKLVDATTYRDPNSCLKHAEEGITLVKKLYVNREGKWRYISLFLGYKSHAYNNLGKEKESLEAIDEMFVAADSMCFNVAGPCEGRARVHGYLSTYYHNMKSYEKAIEHDKIALGIMRKLDGNKVAPLMNLGISFEAAEYPDSALLYKKLAKIELEKLEAKQLYLSKADCEIAVAYQKVGEIDSALFLIKQVLDTCTKYDYSLLSKAQLYGARIFNESKNYEYSWILLQRSKKAIVESGTLENIKIWYEEAATATKSLGMVDSAFYFSDQYVVYHDSIYELGRKEGIRQAEASHVAKEREAEIDGLTSRLGSQKNWIYILSVLLLGALGAFFYSNQKSKKQREQNTLEIRYFLSGKSEIDSPPSIDLFLENVLEVINENMADNTFNVEALASKVFTSRSNLFKKIKPLTGKSPVALIREMRMEKAKLLLETNKFSVKEIAEKVGYEDSSYFSKVFKQYFGFSPSNAA